VLLGGTVGPAPAAALWVTSFVAIFTARGLARGAVRRVSPVERCLVIGELAQVERLRERLAASAAHARVIACLPLTGEGIDELDAPEIVRHLVADLRVQRIIVAPSRMDSVGVVGLIRIAKAAGLRISVLSRMVEGIGSGIEFDEVDGMTMLGVRQFGLSPSSMLLKRLFDLLATIGGMIVVGPLLSIIALMIKLDSHGPVFFRQTRVGRDGRHFRMIKFRSMVVGAEERKADLLALNEVGEGMFKVSDDPRVTRIGRMLRRTSLDELPQLLNVLRGEMSLVGPRPLVVAEDAQIVGLDRARLQLTPGMTGPWQVLGSRVSLQEMVGIDYRYVAGWSLWLDLKILLRTVRHVLRRGNV
jgi:exopolysaccharide biosynthesis polyprenyl glycosylphosphotransferase